MSSAPHVQSVASARACLVLAAVLWSLGSVFMRLLREPLGLGLHEPVLTPLQIAFYRGLFGGFLMLTPSIASEGSDAIDGVQRVYAYCIARPLRLAVYLALIATLFVVGLSAFRVVFHGGAYIAGDAISRWLGERPTAVVTGYISESLRESLEVAEPKVHERTAHSIFGFWWNFPRVLLAAWTFSFVHCAGALLSLILRRASDGQEIAEVHRE